ncbi:MAG: site-specific integrase [Candidatus Paceibacterota bacterium]
MEIDIKLDIDPNKLEEWFKIKGLSSRTIGFYMNYFDKLDVKNIDQEHVHNYLKRNNNLVARALLKNLINYVKTNEFPLELKSLVGSLDIPKQTGRKKKVIPNVITRNQVHLIANSMENIRNRLMVLLTYYCGLRADELLNIKPFDFNWREWKETKEIEGYLKVTGKGNKQREIAVIPDLMKGLYDYIQEISSTITKEDPIFKISHRYWRRTISKASKKAIGKPINPHLLRHSCATYLINSGLEIDEVSQFLGHSDIRTTMIYVHRDKKKISGKVLGAFK